jgi:hypothetical protein
MVLLLLMLLVAWMSASTEHLLEEVELGGDQMELEG